MGNENRQSASIVDALIPTNPLAAVSCWTGVISTSICCPLGILLGPIAIATGILALKKWKMQETSYGEVTSKVRAWIGIVTGSMGILASIVVIVVAIFSRK